MTPRRYVRALAGMVLMFAGLLVLSPEAFARHFKVTGASLRANPGAYIGHCPVHVEFFGSITAEGGGTVKYTFTRSDGAKGPVETLTFSSSGTKKVRTDWQLGGDFSGWEAIKILSPNQIES